MHMVDFGFSTYYIKSGGIHIEQEELDTFRGNMIFASVNQLEFMTTSRRDDLISLCYLLTYMINEGKIQGLILDSNLSQIETFKNAKAAKKAHTMQNLCVDNAACLVQFVYEIFTLKFKDEPDYNNLKDLLTTALG